MMYPVPEKFPRPRRKRHRCMQCGREFVGKRARDAHEAECEDEPVNPRRKYTFNPFDHGWVPEKYKLTRKRPINYRKKPR